MAQAFQKPEPRLAIKKKGGFGSKLFTLVKPEHAEEYNELRRQEQIGLLGFTVKQMIESKSGPVQMWCEWVLYEVIDDDKLDEIENDLTDAELPGYDAHDLEILSSEPKTDTGDD